ncbi:hypothetical protein QBE52_09870 [Clostridiaceae bacterium 35-E11]
MRVGITQSYNDLLNNKKKHNEYKKKAITKDKKDFEKYLKNSAQQLDVMCPIRNRKTKIHLESRSSYFRNHKYSSMQRYHNLHIAIL